MKSRDCKDLRQAIGKWILSNGQAHDLDGMKLLILCHQSVDQLWKFLQDKYQKIEIEIHLHGLCQEDQ